MPNRLFSGHNRTGTTIINRVGDEVDVERRDGTATENKYGKVSDTDVTYSRHMTTFSYRMYESYEERPSERGTSGGRLDTENPRLLFPEGTDIEEDDRVTFPDGKTYNVDQYVPRETHDEYRSTLITG